jgi:hypothetical protein
MSTSPNATTPARGNQLGKLAALIAGLQKHQSDLAPFVIADKKYTVADVIAVLQTRYDTTQAVNTTKANWQAAVKLDHEGRASGQVFLNGIQQTLLAAFAGSVNKLADFGLVGRKPRTVAPATQVATSAKIKATRTARHTMGKKQKAQIHGTVAATSPVTSPVATIPAPVGAPQAPAAPTPASPSPATPSPATPPVTPPAPQHS